MPELRHGSLAFGAYPPLVFITSSNALLTIYSSVRCSNPGSLASQFIQYYIYHNIIFDMFDHYLPIEPADNREFTALQLFSTLMLGN